MDDGWLSVGRVCMHPSLEFAEIWSEDTTAVYSDYPKYVPGKNDEDETSTPTSARHTLTIRHPAALLPTLMRYSQRTHPIY